MFKDKNHLMKLIKAKLGIYAIKLPISDKDLYDLVIIETTLPQFNIFAPYKHKQVLNTMTDAVKDEEDPLVVNGAGVPANVLVRIPNTFGEREIVGVNRIDPYNNLSGLAMSASYETIGSYQDLALAQGMANLSSTMLPPSTFEFIAPDKIRIYNNTSYNSKLLVEVMYTHHPELHTIPLTSRDSFFKLAMLDMKVFLYNNLKHYNDIETAYGHLSLKIDEWSGAEADRDALVDKWTETYHLDQNTLFFI